MFDNNIALNIEMKPRVGGNEVHTDPSSADIEFGSTKEPTHPSHLPPAPVDEIVGMK